MEDKELIIYLGNEREVIQVDKKKLDEFEDFLDDNDKTKIQFEEEDSTLVIFLVD